MYRSFVVQLQAGATDGRFSGRVEHVASGLSFEFTSAEALLEFLCDNIAGEVSAPPQGAP